MNMNVAQLNTVISEANELSSKPNLTKYEERRLSTLMMFASAIKNGASLTHLEQENHNAEEQRQGLPVTNFKNSHLSAEQRATARAWRAFVNGEKRDMVEGNPIPRIGTYTGLGYFVPTEFFASVFAAMAAHDPLFDENSCTVINSTNGRPLPIPIYGDIENVASVVAEGGSQTSTDIDAPGHAVIGAYSYKTPRFVCSLESFDDMDSAISTLALFKQFASDRLRRGIAADLLNGNGTGKTLGLIPSLEVAGVTQIHASGSASMTGGSETGANSIGLADLADLYYSVNSAYRASDKCAWLMADTTLLYIDSIVTKMGLPAGIVKWTNGMPYIFGKPVKISPSMPAIGASNVSVVFGDLSYWVTRIVTADGSSDDELNYVRVYREAPGLIENGNVGLRAFLRADGALAYNDVNSPTPINYLQQHS